MLKAGWRLREVTSKCINKCQYDNDRGRWQQFFLRKSTAELQKTAEPQQTLEALHVTNLHIVSRRSSCHSVENCVNCSELEIVFSIFYRAGRAPQEAITVGDVKLQIPPEEQTPLVEQLLRISQQQQEIDALRDEFRRLKELPETSQRTPQQPTTLNDP